MSIDLKEYLSISGTALLLHGEENLADTDFAQLVDFSVDQRQAITSVVLSNTAITGECFRHLALLPRLRALYGAGTQLKDDAPFDLLSKSIEILNLDHTEVGDRSILKLRNLQHLRSLSLRQTRVTDKGIRFLSATPSLDEYYLNGTIVSDYAKQRLENAIQLDSRNYGAAFYSSLCAIQIAAGNLFQ